MSAALGERTDVGKGKPDNADTPASPSCRGPVTNVSVVTSAYTPPD
jgi:hypothetical protein